MDDRNRRRRTYFMGVFPVVLRHRPTRSAGERPSVLDGRWILGLLVLLIALAVVLWLLTRGG